MEKIIEAATFDNESPKQFAAGFLYGYTGQEDDERDAMLACEADSEDAQKKLTKAFNLFNKGKYDRGT